jgi:hypothetical protein
LARSNSNLEILKLGGDKFDDLFHRHREIGIAHETIVSPGVEHAVLNGSAFSFFALKHVQVRMLVCKLPRNLERLIHAFVFHDEHFGGKGLLFEKMKDLFQGSRQTILFVMSRDDDRQERVQGI